MSASPAQPKPDETQPSGSGRLFLLMRRALVERRMVLEIGAYKIRFLRRGDRFEVDDHVHEALQSGIFLCCPVVSRGTPTPGHWLHHGSSDDLEDIVNPILKDLPAQEIQALVVQMTVDAIWRDRGLSRPASVPAEFGVGQYEKSIADAEADANDRTTPPPRPRLL